jgi:ribonuclease HI
MAFICQTCGAEFDVPPKTLARFPGWTPRTCRAHSPRGKARRRVPRAESLTPDQVLERFTAGPSTGLFTDGSAHPNPGPGGWGVVWVEDGRIRAERHGHVPDTTNNRMELTALIEAHRMLPERAETVIYTDSRLCVDTILSWAPAWERKGWQRKGGPIKNLDLVKELLALHRARPGCRLEWIPSHSGQRWNEYADSLASAWMRAEP